MTNLMFGGCQRHVYIFAMTIFDIKVYIFPVKWCKISIEVGFIDLKNARAACDYFFSEACRGRLLDKKEDDDNE